MTKAKKWLFLLLALCVILGNLGCVSGGGEAADTTTETQVPQPTVDPMKEAYKKDRAGFVVFSRSIEPKDRYVPVAEIMNYESKFSDCNGTWFRDSFTGEDLLIYNSYFYAMENRYIHFELYVEDNDKDFSYIREAVSLDSPFLEQNYSHYEYVWKQANDYVGEKILVSMEQFTDSRWEMKMEALARCRQIVADIPPEYVTQQEKMEYLYDYVCDHVEYVAYEKMEDESYFYDAVCTGKTVCDGYSNMLSLLFNLIGVECCEALGSNSGETDGHTWVVAKLNGQFYNFDPTFEDSNEDRAKGRKYFGFSDDLVSFENIEHEELRVKCTDTSLDYPYVDLIVSSITDKNEIRKIAELTEKRMKEGHNTTTIAVRGIVDKKTYNSFVNKYWKYTKKVKKIESSAEFTRNSTVLYLTATS